MSACEHQNSTQPGEDKEEILTGDAWKEAFSAAVQRVLNTRQAVVRHDAELRNSEAQIEANTTTVGDIQQQLNVVTGCTKITRFLPAIGRGNEWVCNQ